MAIEVNMHVIVIVS